MVLTAYVALHRLWEGDFAYVIWSDRDLVRSAVSFSQLPSTGAELSYGTGARIPGGAYHTLVWLAQQLTPDPQGVWRFQVGLDALAAAVLGLGVGRRFGGLAGALAAAAALGADPNTATQQRLWNPAWLPLFAAVATVAWLRVVADRQAWALLVWGVAIALAGQMHVTALLLAPAMLPGIVAARAPHTVRWLAAAALGATAVYAPYLVSEAAHGWPNTRLLLHPNQLSDASMLVSGDARPWQTAWETLTTLSGTSSVQQLATRFGPGIVAVGAVAPALVAGVLIDLGTRTTPRDQARASVLLGLITAILIETAMFARARYFAMGSSDTTRYLLALTPLTATLVAVAGATAVRAAARWGRGAVPLLATLLALSTGLRLIALDLHTREHHTAHDHWSSLVRWLDGAQRATGWPLDQLAGRLVVAEGTGPHTWRPHLATPIDALLRAQGLAFPGSLTPPCAVLFPTSPADPAPLDDATLAATLGDGVSNPVVDARHDLSPSLALVVYHPSVGRCPTTLSNRYLLTPEEEVAREAWPGTPPGTAHRLTDADGSARWVVNVDLAAGTTGPPLDAPMLVTVGPRDDGQEVSLHANLLRGYAWNGGLFMNGDADHPRLIATLPDGTTQTVDLAAGRVGVGGELTPLRARAQLPAGAALAFAIDVQPQRAWDPRAARGAPTVVQIPLH
jgi:hypothetical protein